MQQDPLITYCSLIPGALLYAPGGLDLPSRKRFRHEDAPSQAASPRSMLARSADGVWTCLWKICAAFSSRADARAHPDVGEHEKPIRR